MKRSGLPYSPGSHEEKRMLSSFHLSPSQPKKRCPGRSRLEGSGARPSNINYGKRTPLSRAARNGVCSSEEEEDKMVYLSSGSVEEDNEGKIIVYYSIIYYNAHCAFF